MFIDYNLLPYFIHEELFLLPEDRQLSSHRGPEVVPDAGKQAKTAEAGSVKTAPAPKPSEPTLPEPAPAGKTGSRVTELPKQEVKPLANPNLIFGKNRRNLLILVEDHQNVVMERADGLLLKDILKALDFTFEDVAIVNICHCREEVDWEVVRKIPFNTLFSFGITHPQLSFTQALAPYELEKSGEKKFLLADKLSVLRSNRSRKIALWNLLKQIFV